MKYLAFSCEERFLFVFVCSNLAVSRLMHNVLWENDMMGGDRWGWIQVENLQLKEARQQAIIGRHFKLLGQRPTQNQTTTLWCIFSWLWWLILHVQTNLKDAVITLYVALMNIEEKETEEDTTQQWLFHSIAF